MESARGRSTDGRAHPSGRGLRAALILSCLAALLFATPRSGASAQTQISAQTSAPAQTSVPPQTSAPAQGAHPGPESLEPAFRLPVGGRPLAAPVLDQSTTPSLVWMISEDGFLYALSEAGRLVARIGLKLDSLDSGLRPRLRIDPFGRPVVAARRRLSVYTRAGNLVWSLDLGASMDAAPVFGSDGRYFLAAGPEAVCLNPSGRLLWSRRLPVAPACPPGIDGSGDLALYLADGSLIVLSPYGTELDRSRSEAPVEVFAPLGTGSEEGSSPRPGAGSGSGGGPASGQRYSLAAGLADGRILLVAVGGRAWRGAGADAEWTLAAPGSAPIVALQESGSTIYGLDRNGLAFAFSASSGSLLWKTGTDCLSGRLQVFADRVVASSKGRAVSLSLSGEVYREARLVNAAETGVIAPSGLLFSPGLDWILSAFRFETRLGAALAASPAAYPKAPDAASVYLSYDPAAADPSRQRMRLADIEKSLRSGTIGAEEPAAAAYCEALALGEFDSAYGRADRALGGDPLSRAWACELLGELGSPDYRGALCEVLARDTDPAVRAAACRALGAVAVDPGGGSQAAFLATAARPVDEETAFALIGAIESLALRSGTPPSADAVRALLELARLPYGARVRDRAVAALGRMAGVSGP